MKDKNNEAVANGAFEATLWAAADKLRNNMDAAEYKHVVLGLIFLKYISDAFEAKHADLDAAAEGADPEDRDEYRAASIFWVPTEARWDAPPGERAAADDRHDRRRGDGRDRARQPSLKGVLPKDYARPALDKQRLGELIDLIGDIALGQHGRPRQRHPRPRLRVLPRTVRQRRGQEGRPVLHAARVVRLLVEMLAPYKGRVYDPCCGSGGMFVQ